MHLMLKVFNKIKIYSLFYFIANEIGEFALVIVEICQLIFYV